MFARPVGSDRSAQVSPRSVERKSRVPAMSAHTTVPDGALSCATLGNGIGVDDGELVGAEVVATAVGDGVGEGAAFGCVVHAVSMRTRRSSARMDHRLSRSARSVV
jgi:hypothetical protein